MTYEEALAFIHDTRYRGGKDGVAHMRLLAERLGHPEKSVPMVHVAGTNGKGSVCAMIQAMLRQGGYRVGLYTSPYLQRYNERMRIDGKPISDQALCLHAETVSRAVFSLREEGVLPTEFEIGTAIAFQYFAHERVDIAVIEVGLGGRHDSTNVITPLVSVITSIGLDHTRMLGDTPALIAAEKAGIAKPAVPMVLYPGAAADVVGAVSEACLQIGAPLHALPGESATLLRQSEYGLSFRYAYGLWRFPELCVEIPGEHQMLNAAAALTACLLLADRGYPLSDADLLAGLRAARWPGRLEWVSGSPWVLMDGAHNPHGMASLCAFLEDRLPNRRIVALTGMLREKDAAGAMALLARHVACAVTVSPITPRALPAETVAELLKGNGLCAEPQGSLKTAYARARELAGPEGIVLVTGSLYLIGEMRDLLGLGDCMLRAEGEAHEI